jgi:hypothetical protein
VLGYGASATDFGIVGMGGKNENIEFQNSDAVFGGYSFFWEPA